MYEVKDFSKEEWKSTKISKISTAVINCYSDTKIPECYSIFKETYKYLDKNKHYWDQAKYYIRKNGKTILTFNRNYSSSPSFSYIKNIDNGKEYIITSGDYQCLTVINLTDLTINSYCLGDHDKGWGFCPTKIYSSYGEDGILSIRVEGCYWACPFQFFYLRNPDLDNLKFPEDLEMFDADRDDNEDDNYSDD